jgi:hypothetical protein
LGDPSWYVVVEVMLGITMGPGIRPED